jgi:hypothetical protein
MLGFQTIRVEQTLGVIGASEGCSRNRYYRAFKTQSLPNTIV